MENSRRRFLQIAAAAPVAALLGTRALAQAPAVCSDPATLPAAQKSLRKSLDFVDVSTDPAKRCGLCAFFQAKGTCGSCQLLNSTVSPGSVCSSFAAKA